MPRPLHLALLVAAFAMGAAPPAAARVDIAVDLASQTMHVTSSTGTYVWPISSARMGYSTPRGSFGIQRMEAMHRSHKYFNSPMPHSLFFSGGYAIHGSYETADLGRPASHGCIRISPGHAAALFDMVAAEGGRISIAGTAPVEETGRTARREATRSIAARRYRVRGGYDPQGWDDDGFGAFGYAPADPRVGRWLAEPTDE